MRRAAPFLSKLCLPLLGAAAYGWQTLARTLPGPRVPLALPLLEPGRHDAVSLLGLLAVWLGAFALAARIAPPRRLPAPAAALIRGVATLTLLVAVQAAAIELVRQAVVGFAWDAAVHTWTPWIAAGAAAVATLAAAPRARNAPAEARDRPAGPRPALPIVVAAVALPAIAVAALALTQAQGRPADTRLAPPGWVLVAHGLRGGSLWKGSLPGGGDGALYLPAHATQAQPLPLVVVGGGAQARGADLLGAGDELIWNGTTPRFAALSATDGRTPQVGSLLPWARRTLPVELAASRGDTLRQALATVLMPAAARRAAANAAGLAPRGWRSIVTGPAGGTIWEGVIPDHVVPGVHRASLVYLPPGVVATRRYPALYLLHGLRGSPYSFVGGLRLAAVADDLIMRHRVPPFVAILPPAGRTPAFDGEWSGPWESYVVRDVLPWARRHLPVHTTRSGRAIAGFSAGGYGAVDIGLRHPGLFGTLASLSGYYAAPHDGSLAGARPAELAAHDPSLLVRRHARLLRRDHVRVYVASGLQEHRVLAASRRFSQLLAQLHVEHRLALRPGGHHGRTWRLQLPAALTYVLRGSNRMKRGASRRPAHARHPRLTLSEPLNRGRPAR